MKHTPTKTRTRLTEDDFCHWIGEAAPGDTLEYHRGFLAIDRFVTDRDGRKVLAALAQRAHWAAERGLVFLVQRRLRPGGYSYLAIVRGKRR
jgi:hypothetical protein